ncbi:Uncharacterized protein FWK35_00017079 [Aphis craccivora]|uniref:Uncharacterized protein n=1 Tax=Aphis craccivora TaxID=307492 RepID=A0A6G0YDM5_APHCR|nr:Uncharacterized protein FWK35_00017079 [Aphis craccivora]
MSLRKVSTTISQKGGQGNLRRNCKTKYVSKKCSCKSSGLLYI